MRILTTDLYEGAWFLSQGMSLENLWTEGNGKRAIVFEFNGERLEGLKEMYRKGKAQANVLELKASLNELKDKMFWLLRNKSQNPVPSHLSDPSVVPPIWTHLVKYVF